MRTLPLPILLISIIVLCCSCEDPLPPPADIVIFNGEIITVDKENPTVEALAIRGDRIIDLGSFKEMEKYLGDSTEQIDLNGQFAMPGFIEGHGHFSGLGKSLLNLNFLTSKSWQDIVAQVAEAARNAQPGEWIEGRGWHQEKWTETPGPEFRGYPFHYDLSAISPDNPVILYHASGHALFANDAAMKAAGITKETPDPMGGEIVRDIDGTPIGVFEERAMNYIAEAYNSYLSTLTQEDLIKKWYDGIALAEEDCLKKGITSFQDAGSKFEEIDRYTKMAENGELDVRLWAMLRHSYDEMKDRMDAFPIIDAGNQFFTCKAIKTEVDGALGAFGAWLLQPYNDKPDFVGQNTTSIAEVKNIAGLAMQHDMQLCVHAIGDRANRVVLDVIEEQFENNPEKEDLRWRIEHAQHLDTADIPRFKEWEIIASMQGIHCTSDAPFVVKRLGVERAMLGAYPWRSLLDEGVVIANGTDAPVEDVDPIPSFYASVTRKRADTGLELFPEQRMTREEAVYSYTLGNAFAGFEEEDKGSLEKGKLADIVVLSNNLLECTDDEILETKVLLTMVGGLVKYERE